VQVLVILGFFFHLLKKSEFFVLRDSPFYFGRCGFLWGSFCIGRSHPLSSKSEDASDWYRFDTYSTPLATALSPFFPLLQPRQKLDSSHLTSRPSVSFPSFHLARSDSLSHRCGSNPIKALSSSREGCGRGRIWFGNMRGRRDC
jgi:hypothetical protein